MTTINCPVCWRPVDVDGVNGSATVATHQDPVGRKCPMSRNPVPVISLREVELVHTADTVLRMAADLRDDSRQVWGQLRATNAEQLREWLMIALAAINIDQPARDLLQWVEQLPTADAA